jgi:hypothetical protein
MSNPSFYWYRYVCNVERLLSCPDVQSINVSPIISTEVVLIGYDFLSFLL